MKKARGNEKWNVFALLRLPLPLTTRLLALFKPPGPSLLCRCLRSFLLFALCISRKSRRAGEERHVFPFATPFLFVFFAFFLFVYWIYGFSLFLDLHSFFFNTCSLKSPGSAAPPEKTRRLFYLQRRL